MSQLIDVHLSWSLPAPSYHKIWSQSNAMASSAPVFFSLNSDPASHHCLSEVSIVRPRCLLRWFQSQTVAFALLSLSPPIAPVCHHIRAVTPLLASNAPDSRTHIALYLPYQHFDQPQFCPQAQPASRPVIVDFASTSASKPPLLVRSQILMDNPYQQGLKIIFTD
jgi:hypothetical protein